MVCPTGLWLPRPASTESTASRSGFGAGFGQDGFEHLAGACPFQAVTVPCIIARSNWRSSGALQGRKSRIRRAIRGPGRGGGRLPGAPLGGLQVVAQTGEKVVGVDTVLVKRRLPITCLVAGRGIGGTAACHGTQGAPQSGGVECESGAACGQNRPMPARSPVTAKPVNTPRGRAPSPAS